MNTMTPAGIICERLRSAKLLDVAERAAKRAGARLADCLVAGGPETPGHVAVWAALSSAGAPDDMIAGLVGWPVEAIRRALKAGRAPAPKRKPGPKAGQKRGAGKPDYYPPAVLPDVPDLVVDDVAASPVACVEMTVEAGALDLAARVGYLDVLREVSMRRGVPVTALLGRARTKSVVLARGEVVWRMRHLRKCSMTEIGRALGRDHSTAMDYLHRFKPTPDLLALLPHTEAA